MKFIYHFHCSWKTYTIDGIIERDKRVIGYKEYCEIKEQLKDLYKKSGVDTGDSSTITLTSLTFLHYTEGSVNESERQEKG